MRDSVEIYERLIRTLDERLPAVATQVREEVARGQLLPGSKLSVEEREERQTSLREAKLQGIAKEDMAAAPYTGDDRLVLLCDALLSLAETMFQSRRAVLDLLRTHGVEHSTVTFADPEQGEVDELDLQAEVARSEQASARARGILVVVREQISGSE